MSGTLKPERANSTIIHWVAATSALYGEGKSPTAPLIMEYAWQYSQKYPAATPEMILQEARQFKRQIKEDPTKVLNIASRIISLVPGMGPILSAAIDLGGQLAAGHLAERRSAWEHLASDLATRPLFWEEHANSLFNNPAYFQALQKLSVDEFGIDPLMSASEIGLRIPAYARDIKIAELLDRAQKGENIQSEAQKELRSRFTDIESMLDQTIIEQKTANAEVGSLESLMQRQQDALAQRERAEVMRAEFSDRRAVFSALNAVLDATYAGPDAQRLVQAGMAINNMVETIALYAIGAATGVGAAAAVASGLSTLMSLSAGTRAQADPVTDALKTIDFKIDAIRSEMRQSFAITNQKLDAIFEQGFQTYREVVLLGHSIAEVREFIQDVQSSLLGMEDRLSRIIRVVSSRESTGSRVSCLSFRRDFDFKIENDDYTYCLYAFYHDATEHARDAASINDEPFIEAEVLRVLSGGTSAAIKFVSRFARDRLGIGNLTEPVLHFFPNPMAWAAGADAYLRFTRDWPTLTLQTPGLRAHLEEMLSIGSNVRLVLDRLGGNGDNGDPNKISIFDALFDYYQNALTSFTTLARQQDTLSIPLLAQQALSSSEVDGWKAFASSPVMAPSTFAYVVENYPQPGVSKDFTDQMLPLFGISPHPPAEFPLLKISDEAWAKLPSWLTSRGGDEPGSATGAKRIRGVKLYVTHLVQSDISTGMRRAAGYLKGYVVVTLSGQRSNRFQPTDKIQEIKSDFKYDFPEMPPVNDNVVYWAQQIGNAVSTAFGVSSLQSDVERALAVAMQSEASISVIAWKKTIRWFIDEPQSLVVSHKLDAARALMAAYFEIAAPSLLTADETRLLLFGSDHVRVPDYAVVSTLLSNISADGTSIALSEPHKSAAAAMMEHGIWTYIERRWNESRSLLVQHTGAMVSRPEPNVVLDSTLMRLQGALSSLP